MVAANANVNPGLPPIGAVDPVYVLQVVGVIVTLGLLVLAVWNFFSAATELVYHVIKLGILSYLCLYLVSSISFMPEEVRAMEFMKQFDWMIHTLSSRLQITSLLALLRNAGFVG